MTPCRKCDAKCCRYFAFHIVAPKTKEDIETIRWYLAHTGVTVFIERRRWYVEIDNDCRYLTKDFKCSIYDKRPAICKEHEPSSCEFTFTEFDHEHIFHTMEEFDRYLAARKKRPKATKKRKSKGK